MMVITMAKLRMAHASTHGARKPPGPKLVEGVKVKSRGTCMACDGELSEAVAHLTTTEASP